jgi:hypothetical protein
MGMSRTQSSDSVSLSLRPYQAPRLGRVGLATDEVVFGICKTASASGPHGVGACYVATGTGCPTNGS